MKLIFLLALVPILIYSKNDPFFISNNGQNDSEIKYYSNLSNMNIFIKNDGIYFDFFTINSENDKVLKNGEVVKFHFLNSNKLDDFKISSNRSMNYFIGNNKDKWVRNVPITNEILIKNVYDNIDVRLYFENEEPRYDFIVNKGGNVSDIKFAISGLELKELGQNYFKGNLALGEYSNDGLKAYQKNNIINSNFIYNSNNEDYDVNYFSINVGEYDKNETLIIDPIIYSSYLGWNGKETINAIQNIDENTYIVAGTTESENFPVSEGVYQDYVETGINIFIAEYKRNGLIHEFVRGTYFGGSGEDIVNTMKIDNTHIYFGGYTTSNNFPFEGPIDQTYAAKKDGFIAALSLDMTQLKYSYHVGAEDDDEITDIKVKNGELYFCGNSKSLDIPTVKAKQSSMRGVQDGIIGKNNAAGTSIEYLTYIGGSGEDMLSAIEVTNLDGVCWIGSTKSIDLQTFPDQANDKKAPGDNFDIMMGMYSDELTDILLTTYLGGTGDDFGVDLKYIAGQEFYFIGHSQKEANLTLPITVDSYQELNAGQADILFGLRKVSELSKLTFIGGEKNDIPHRLDRFMPNGDFIIVGETESRSFPIVSEDFNPVEYAGKKDGLIVYASSDFEDITYSAYFGGKNDDQIFDFDILGDKKIRFAGKTLSKDLTMYGRSSIGANNSGNAAFIGEVNKGSIQIQSPLGGFDYCPTVTVPIIFTPKNLDDNNIVDIYLVNEVLKTKELIVENFNETRYDWIIPDGITPDQNYKVSIEHASAVFIESPEFFGIKPSPEVTNFEIANTQSRYCEGDSVVLNITIDNASSPNIIWQKDGVEIAKNKQSTLKILDLSTDDTGVYRAIVEGDCPPNATSEEIYIEVTPSTEITDYSDDIMISVDKELKLYVNTIGAELEYQWYFDGNELAGKTDSTLIIQNINFVDDGVYKCEVNGACGESQSTEDIRVEVYINSVKNNEYFKSVNYSNSTLDLSFELKNSGKYKFTIIDILGKSVYSEDLNLLSRMNKLNKNINLNDGFYLINISNENENISYKIIINE